MIYHNGIYLFYRAVYIKGEKEMYAYKKEFNGTFEEACQRTIEELQKEGFGILTEIDVKETLKKKLNKNFPKYKILGACNPLFAYNALQEEKEIGVFLPCNVIVFEENEKVYVSGVLPTATMSMIQNEKLEKIAEKVEEKIKKAISETTVQGKRKK